jgi:hypothetical protein
MENNIVHLTSLEPPNTKTKVYLNEKEDKLKQINLI